MKYVKLVAKAIVWGVGIGIGVSLMALIADKLGKESVGNPQLEPDQLSKLEVRSKDIAIKDGRVIASGRIVNTLDEPVRVYRIAGIVRERGKPIEECTRLSDTTLQPSQDVEFVLSCSNQWSELSEDQLEVTIRVDRAFLIR
jgi:hypothetical protein